MLNFTDEQIRELTARAIAAPEIITQLNVGKANAVALKADYLDLDETNEVFTDNYKNIIDQYHLELKYLNGVEHTDYSTSNIDTAGALSPGNIHFPDTPIWVGFEPKKHGSNEGSPTSSWVNTEPLAMTDVTTWKNYLVSGFTDGAVTDTTATVFVGNDVEVVAGGFSALQRVLLTNGSNYRLATITAVTAGGTGVQKLTLSTILTSGTFAIGTTVKNFNAGFLNTDREGATVPTLAAYMAGLEAQLDASVATWESRLNSELAALSANDALSPDAAEIATAITNVGSAKTDIDTWQALASTGVGTGRFGNTKLLIITGRITIRGTQITARITQITTRLGSISQNPEGDYTGSGQYFTLFDNINFRVNKVIGTLRNFYQSDLIISSFDQQITIAQALSDRDSAVFDIHLLAANGNGTTTIVLEDATGLSALQAVKIMSDSVTSIDAVIQSIVSNTVVLDVTVAITYLTADNARLVV